MVDRRPVTSKRDHIQRWANGEFGNKPRSWDTDPGIRPIVVRYRVAGAPWCFYNVVDVEKVLNQIEAEGGSRSLVYFNECPPDHHLLIQGEVAHINGELVLEWSTVAKPMRVALAEMRNVARGLTALTILRHYLRHADLVDIQDLLDLYPDHVIEFSTYRVSVGSSRGRSTLIWEVRLF